MSKIPDGWLKYKPVGDVIEGSRFLAIKTPLDNRRKFNCTNAISIAEEQSGRRVGMVIDLTNTDKYYNPSTFIDEGIRYLKIKVPSFKGKERIIPPRNLVEQFHNAVNEFENDNQFNNDLILVHCTHGLNRTGYFVCKYLIDRQSVPPPTAIQMFNHARGHSMEREHYINDLLRKPSTINAYTNHHIGRGRNDFCSLRGRGDVTSLNSPNNHRGWGRGVNGPRNWGNMSLNYDNSVNNRRGRSGNGARSSETGHSNYHRGGRGRGSSSRGSVHANSHGSKHHRGNRGHISGYSGDVYNYGNSYDDCLP